MQQARRGDRFPGAFAGGVATAREPQVVEGPGGKQPLRTHGTSPALTAQVAPSRRNANTKAAFILSDALGCLKGE